MFLQTNRVSGLQDAAMGRDGFRRNVIVRMIRQEEGSFETLTLGLAQERTGAMFVGDGVKSPGRSLGVAIPRHIHFGTREGLFGDDGRLFRGITGPVVPEGTVVLYTFTQQTRVHVHMEDRSTIRLKFGHGSLGTPVNQGVAIGE